MDAYVGTSGWSYKEWRGSFYPEDTKAKDMLSFYATRLATVEINNTFYRMPKRAVVRGWAEQVSEDFAFVLKASRRITHQQRLAGSNESVGFLHRNSLELGDKLGAILFQLPPFLRKNVELLGAFVDELPEDWPCAMEFRHESWFDDEVYDVLRRRDVALCATDAEGRLVGFERTASFGYLRLRDEEYTEETLSSWADRLRGTGWERVFVYFKHEDHGPMYAARFQEMLGRPGR